MYDCTIIRINNIKGNNMLIKIKNWYSKNEHKLVIAYLVFFIIVLQLKRLHII